MNTSGIHFILLSLKFIYFFKTQLTVSYVNNELWKLKLSVKTYHGGKHSLFIIITIIIIIIIIGPSGRAV